MGISPEDCLEALREARERVGRSPSKREYAELDLTPSAGTIKRVVGGWNRAKELAGLETYTAGDNWNNPIQSQPEWLDLPEGYEWEEMTPQQRWYYKNRKHRIAVKERRRNELAQWFFEFKRDRYRCEECGEDHPFTIEFHHVETKGEDVSVMVNHGYAKSTIKAEIERCIALCANCHRKEHVELPGWWDSERTSPVEWNDLTMRELLQEYPDKRETDSKKEYRGRIRAWTHRYKAIIEGCNRCDEVDPTCVEFHHPDAGEKTLTIGALIEYGPHLDQLLTEIEKCEPICRNCHRIEHQDQLKAFRRTQD